ncbi:MAG: RNA polymerase sigma factor [Pseudomonadota bacterium]
MTESNWATLQRRLLLRYDDLKARLTRRLGSADLAGDALQDTWLRLERGPRSVTVASPDSYLLRMALNTAYDRMRDENRRLTSVEISSLLDLADDAPDAARIVESRAELEAFKTVLAELSARQREILLAARLDNMSRREIARHYGISVRLVLRELQEAQDYCAARLKKISTARFTSIPENTSSRKDPAAANVRRSARTRTKE